MEGIHMGLSIQHFAMYGGQNMRIEKAVSGEQKAYQELHNADENNDTTVTLDEYFRYLAKVAPDIKVTNRDILIAKYIDEMLNFPDVRVRKDAAEQLGNLKATEAVEVMYRVLGAYNGQKSDVFVRIAIQNALAQMGEKHEDVKKAQVMGARINKD